MRSYDSYTSHAEAGSPLGAYAVGKYILSHIIILTSKNLPFQKFQMESWRYSMGLRQMGTLHNSK
jgi:hypothetical protein